MADNDGELPHSEWLRDKSSVGADGDEWCREREVNVWGALKDSSERPVLRNSVCKAV